jgi:Fe-S-cluster containining protein
MDFDFSPYFKRYEALRQLADQTFDKVSREYPQNVKCKSGCADCCHALFDLTLIEALYINHKFNEKYQGPEREALLEKANRLDRRITKIKRRAGQDLQAGKPEQEILAELASVRVPCPLLNDEDLCELYEFRPITCRFYGIPTAIGGAGRTCGLSGFEPGRSYPTVNLDRVHQQLQQITSELVRDMGSKYIKLSDLLIPLSMAMLTLFDAEYLGVDYKDVAKPQGSVT